MLEKLKQRIKSITRPLFTKTGESVCAFVIGAWVGTLTGLLPSLFIEVPAAFAVLYLSIAYFRRKQIKTGAAILIASCVVAVWLHFSRQPIRIEVKPIPIGYYMGINGGPAPEWSGKSPQAIIYLWNETDSDYTNLDFYVSTNGPITNLQEVSNLSCVPTPSQYRMQTRSLRMRCDKLPRHATATFLAGILAIQGQAKTTSEIPQQILIWGTFTAGAREYPLNFSKLFYK